MRLKLYLMVWQNHNDKWMVYIVVDDIIKPISPQFEERWEAEDFREKTTVERGN